MSVTEVERFNTDAKADSVLRDQLTQHSASVAEVVAFAAARGYSFSDADVKDYAKANASTQLDEAQLDAVAGGAASPYPIIVIVLLR